MVFTSFFPNQIGDWILAVVNVPRNNKHMSLPETFERSSPGIQPSKLFVLVIPGAKLQYSASKKT